MAVLFVPTVSVFRPLAAVQRSRLARPVTLLHKAVAQPVVGDRHMTSVRLRPATSMGRVSLSRECLYRSQTVQTATTASTVTTMTLRRASTVPSDRQRDASAAAAVAASAVAHADAQALPLDWNTFFQLRKTRRRIQQAFGLVGGLTGALAGGLFLGSGAAEPLIAQVPLDPFLTLGLMTLGFASLGWLVGPSLGNVVFYAWKRPYQAQMTLKETQFFARVKKNRVDPSASSAGNPVPDFYGEKISSVAGYRQWLKDQRAFNKKRTTFV